MGKDMRIVIYRHMLEFTISNKNCSVSQTQVKSKSIVPSLKDLKRFLATTMACNTVSFRGKCFCIKLLGDFLSLTVNPFQLYYVWFRRSKVKLIIAKITTERGDCKKISVFCIITRKNWWMFVALLHQIKCAQKSSKIYNNDDAAILLLMFYRDTIQMINSNDYDYMLDGV